MTLAHCHSCRNFIAVAGSLGRSDKRFCSAACKQRDYRRREAEKKASRARLLVLGPSQKGDAPHEGSCPKAGQCLVFRD